MKSKGIASFAAIAGSLLVLAACRFPPPSWTPPPYVAPAPQPDDPLRDALATGWSHIEIFDGEFLIGYGNLWIARGADPPSLVLLRHFENEYPSYLVPAMARSGQTIAITYDSCFISPDAGATWSSSQFADPQTRARIAGSPAVYLANGSIYVAGIITDGPDYETLTIWTSRDMGVTWVRDDVPDIGGWGDWSLAFHGSDLFFAYYGGRGDNLTLWKLTDPGDGTWAVASELTVDPHGGCGLANTIAIYGQSVYIAYYDGANARLTLAVSDITLLQPWNISVVDGRGDVGDKPSLAANENGLFISYDDTSHYGVAVAASTDYGGHWQRTLLVRGCSGPSSIAASGGVVAVATDGAYVISVSEDLGSTWITHVGAHLFNGTGVLP